jgi:hypothetical protein
MIVAGVGLWATVAAGQTAGADELAALRKEVAALRATVALQQAEIDRLRSGNAPAAVNQATAAAAGEAVPEKLIYRGRQQTRQWFETMFARHGPSIYTDGTACYDLGGLLLARTKQETYRNVRLHGEPEVQGVYFAPPGVTVLKIIAVDEAVVRIPEFKYSIWADRRDGSEGWVKVARQTVYLKGLVTAGLAEGAVLEDRPLLYLGEQPATGFSKPIRSYAVLSPVTEARFAAALADGLVLKTYSLVGATYNSATDSNALDRLVLTGPNRWLKVQERSIP